MQQVIISLVDLLASAAQIDLRQLQLLRAFRALRMLTRIEGLKLLVVSLADSVMALSSVAAITFIVWTVFAIIGVTFFKGTLWFCNVRCHASRQMPSQALLASLHL